MNEIFRSDRLWSRQVESRLPPSLAQIDPFEDGGHLAGGDLDAPVLGLREAEAAFFQPLDPGITVPSFSWR
jgi:hypothetical protein